ncbi:MAG: hypothetical protein ACI9UT_001289 [Flavobacteriales bacterium]|jgi:hypothetical protein
MSSDLLFSILPREGKVAISHDSQKVAKIDKLECLRVLNDDEKVLKGEEKEARKKQQQRNKKEQSPEQEVDPDKVDEGAIDTKQKKRKGPKHLDFYV